MGVYNNTDTIGQNDHYEAQLVAKGYSQTYDVNYNESFAPVAKMSIVIPQMNVGINRFYHYHRMRVLQSFGGITLIFRRIGLKENLAIISVSTFGFLRGRGQGPLVEVSN